jgi:patatin-like phospholipase/acyl hydrolase
MDHCPLHPAVTRWRSPCIIRFKPDHAGVRLLSLDGGGMRGIVEIEVLRAIEGELGGHIPIREFFDLIVGTSTGGIIALGFGVKNWELKNCSQRFQSLCWEAFSPRKLSNIPGLRHMITLKHAAKYETTPLRNVLEKNFGHGRLFGGNSEEDPNHAAKNHAAKVAVTATDEAGKRAIMLANYSRKDTTQNKRRKGYYDFPRPDDPDLELKIWEAAAATSAAPSFFKPFVHRSTNRTYLDGALYHNNPVRLVHRERKLLWPDVADKHPDIFLSIGTSQNSSEVNKDLPLGPSASQSTRRRARIKELKPEKPTKSAFPKLRQIFKAMHNRMDNILDAEIAWREFCVDVADIDGPSKDAYRYIRINPDIGETPPNLDDVNAMSKLKASTRSALQSSESDSRAQIEKVSHVLVSSCFYYERTALPKSEADKACSCSGRILCRFEDGSPHLRSLGYYLRQQQTKDFGPYFEIENDADSTQVIKLPILPSTITDMIELASFLVDIPDIRLLKRTTEVTISLHLRSSHLSPQGYPISGFPRSIMAEQTVKAAPEDLTPPIRKSSSLGQILKHKPFLSSFENLRSSGIPGRPRASNRSVSEPIPESTPEKARPEISKTTMSMADVGKQKRGSRSLPHDFPAAEVQSERSTGPPSNAYEAPSISQRTRPRSPRQSAISPLSEHASFTSARSRLIIQSSSTNQYSTTSNTGEQHPTSRSGFIVPELEHLAAPVSSSGLGSRYQPGSGTSNGGISREDSYQRKTTIPSRETRAGRPDPKWYTDRGPAADTTRAAQTQHSRKPQTQSDPEEEKVRAQVTSRIEELNSQAEAEAIRKIEAVRYSTNSLDTDRRNDTNQQVSSRPKLSHESRHNSLTAALSPHRRTTPLSHAATQRLNPRHVSSPPYLPSPSPGLRSITSSVSLYSDGQLADINYSSSDSIDNFDDGFEERRRERARRVPSFIWSDAQQSDSTDITSLGRRNL